MIRLSCCLTRGFSDKTHKHLPPPQPRVPLCPLAVAPNNEVSSERKPAERHQRSLFLRPFLFHERRVQKVPVWHLNKDPHKLCAMILPARHHPGNIRPPQRPTCSQAVVSQQLSGTCAAGPPLRCEDDVILRAVAGVCRTRSATDHHWQQTGCSYIVGLRMFWMCISVSAKSRSTSSTLL